MRKVVSLQDTVGKKLETGLPVGDAVGQADHSVLLHGLVSGGGVHSSVHVVS